MGDESNEMHSEDDKGSAEKKNKKRTVKTVAQLQALEKFFNEHKYPAEALKVQFAEAVGLTEKQVSGWFCHRRLKDKKLMNGDNNLTGKQERSSGVIQDRGSGHKQDSCGSTKQGDERNFDNKEVESERLMSKDSSAVDLAREHGNHYAGKYCSEDDTNSGSSSPIRDMPNHRDHGRFDVETSMHQMPKFPAHERQVKPRPGPSGYLKLKNRVENSAITAVKRQLGKHYRDDGPPLTVEFDPIPPGAFEFPLQNPVHETFYAREVAIPASSNAARVRQNPKFDEGRDHETSIASYSNHNNVGPSLKTRHEFRSFSNYTHQNTPLGNGSVTYPHQTASKDQYEGSARIIQQRSRLDHLSYAGKAREIPTEPQFNKFGTSGLIAAQRESAKSEWSDLTTVRETSSLNNGFSRQMFKPPKRINEELPGQYQRSPLESDNFQKSYPAARYGKMLPPSSSDDDEDVSAETSSSVD